ncbi:MAG: TonB-dependent receptor [Proteobacteria bacterium]|nr:TonB-dependent receptor [Pseudomonadota bacterium]
MRISIIVGLIFFTTMSWAEDITGTGHGISSEHLPSQAVVNLSGTVLEKGTKKILDGVTIYIKETNQQANTDKNGWFSLDVRPGTYTIIIPLPGYDKFEETVKPAADQSTGPYTFRLTPLIVNPYKIVVRSKKKRTAVSSQTISIEEASMTPGSNRDVLNVVSNMPGVASVSAFGGYGSGLVIRGSSSDDSSFFIDDHEIPLMYHFGGLESVIEPELVESIDYDAGGFSPEYGETIGGVVALKLKEPRTDRFGGYVNVSLLSSSIMIEGPVSEKSSAAFSFKRGFIDIYTRIAMDIEEDLKDEVKFLEYPKYSDASFIFSHAFSKKNTFKLVVISAFENSEVIISDEDVSSRISNRISQDLTFSMFMAEWYFKRGKWSSVFSPMIGFDRLDIDAGTRAYFVLKQDPLNFSEKIDFDMTDNQKIRFGGRLKLDRIRLNSSLWSRGKEGEAYHNSYENEINADNDGRLFTPSFYIMDQVTMGPWMVIPGVHALYDGHTEHGYIDPRLLAKYAWSESLTLKGALGLYSKTPPLDECTEPWGTEKLKPERSVHTVCGLEYTFTDAISLDVQGYYKRLYDMVVRIDENDPTIYDNEGQGRIYGAEIFLNHRQTDRFFGWISYSWSVSRRTDADDGERYYSIDIPNNLRAVASYKLNRNWTIGAKYTYASGTPYTDLLNVETVYDVDNDEYIPLYTGPVNNKRLKGHHQLDVRIDKMWIFDTYVLSAYLDVRNVLRQKIYIDKDYNADYTESENQESLESVIPFIFLGMKIIF